MIIFFLIFFIILAISLFLAYLSMKDYQEIPKIEKQYGIYLVRKPEFLTSELIGTIADLCKEKILSFERLFKGRSSALVIFGPKKILTERFNEILGLLELEDYTKVAGAVAAWEVSKKNEEPGDVDIFTAFPHLEDDEHFFWQVIVNGNQGQIRAVLVSQDIERRKILISALEKLGEKNLHKIPRPFTSTQAFESYKKRIFVPAYSFKLSFEEILGFTGLHRK